MDKLVDFSQPIEAVHEDGAVLPVQGYAAGTSHYAIVGHPTIEVCRRDGSTNTAWTIRNVTPANPSTPSNEELTQRMEKLVRAFALCDPDGPTDDSEADLIREAQAIVSDLPKPVDPIDPDLIEARRIVCEMGAGGIPYQEGRDDWRPAVKIALAGVKAGRTLAAGGAAHE